MISGGENLLFIAKQLGHTNIETLLRFYAKWIEPAEDKRRHEFVADYGKSANKV